MGANVELKEYKEDFSALVSGQDTGGRRILVDALKDSRPFQDLRVRPFFEQMEEIVEASYRIGETIDDRERFFGGVDIHKAVQKVIHLADREAPKRTFIDAAIFAMIRMEAGTRIIRELIRQEDTRDGFIYLGQLTWEGLRARPNLRSQYPPLTTIMLGDNNTQSLMKTLMSPYRQALALSLKAMSLEKLRGEYRDSSDKAFEIASRKARSIRPEDTAGKLDRLNILVKLIEDERARLMGNLSGLNDTTLEIGVNQLNPQVLREQLSEAKKTGTVSGKLRKLLTEKEELAAQIRAQIQLAATTHLAAINGIDFSMLMEWARNLALVGEEVARLSVVRTMFDSAATGGMALKAANMYLMTGNVKQDELDRYALKRFGANKKYLELPESAQSRPDLSHHK